MNKLKIFSCNMLTIAYNMVKPRDKRIWLFGSWFGERFSDNSRFLFQYVSDNKKKYGIKKAVWVSRDPKLVDELRRMGYDAYLMNSRESRYYHLHAGVHLICNAVDKGVHEGDILGRYSFGAVKLQLWHGIGIKASFRLRNDEKGSWKQDFKHALQDNRLLKKFIMYPGDWGSAYYLATSKEVARVRKLGLGVGDDQILISSYPRMALGIKLRASEKEFLNKLDEYKKQGKRIVLHLPTYRDTGNEMDQYVYPVSSPEFISSLEKENIIWIDKPHAAAESIADACSSPAVVLLDKEFDVNVLYQKIDMLVTDYSSASTDCIYHHIPVAYYIPDQDVYEKGNRGFVNDFELYCPGPVVKSLEELSAVIISSVKGRFFDKEMSERYDRTFQLLFDGRRADLDQITRALSDKVWPLKK